MVMEIIQRASQRQAGGGGYDGGMNGSGGGMGGMQMPGGATIDIPIPPNKVRLI